MFPTNIDLVSNIAFGGDGVIRHNGKVVFVPFVLPDERVEFEVTSSKKSHAFGKLLKIIEANPRRVAPKCEYYGSCGGCQLQHASYDLQLEIKKQFVEDAFSRIGKLKVNVLPVVGTEYQWAYRRRIRLHERGDVKGFIGVDGKTLVPITHCEIFSGENLEIDSDVFVQAHPEQSERLYQDLFEQVTALGSPKVLDFYCGIGVLTGRLAAHGCQITGVELNAKAIEWAQKNVSTKVDWVLADVGAVALAYLKSLRPEVVLVNPPRTGLSGEVLQALSQQKPKHIFYTSCMPATLARDLKVLVDAGYLINSCQPYDLFPQTTHVETVVHLSVNTAY